MTGSASADTAANRARSMMFAPQFSPDVRLWLGVFMITSVVYLLTTNYGPVFFVDGAAAFLPAWHLVNHGHLALDDGTVRLFAFVRGEDGQLYSNRPPGLVLLATPAYLVLRIGSAEPSGVPGAVTSCLATAAAVATMALLLAPLIGDRAARYGAYLLGFGTSLWSVAAAEYFPHGPNVLWLSLALIALVRGRDWLAGIAFAAAITTRPHLAVIALVIGLAATRARRSLTPLFAVGVPSVAGLLALMSYNKRVFGNFDIQGGYADYVNTPISRGALSGLGQYSVNVLGSLVSGPRGLLVLTPVLIVLLPGLVRGWRAAPWWVRAAAVAGSLYMLVQWRIQSGHNGFLGGYLFYSYRYTTEWIFLLSPLLALSWREWIRGTEWRRQLFLLSSLVSVWIQGVGAVLYDIDTQDAFHAWLAWSPAMTLLAASPLQIAVAVLLLVGLCLVPVHPRLRQQCAQEPR